MNINIKENDSSLELNQKNTIKFPIININNLNILNKNINPIRLIKKQNPYKNVQSRLYKNLSNSNISRYKSSELFPFKLNNNYNKNSIGDLNSKNKNLFITYNINNKNLKKKKS